MNTTEHISEEMKQNRLNGKKRSFAEENSTSVDPFADIWEWMDNLPDTYKVEEEKHIQRMNSPKVSEKLAKSDAMHKKNLKNKGLVRKVYGTANPPRHDFNINAESWVDNLLSDNPKESAVDQLLGAKLESRNNFIPQRKVFKVECSLSTKNLRAAAFQFALAAQTMGIEVDETAALASGGQVGTLYIMYLVIYYDLLKACLGEIPIFADVHREYANLRAALTPRVVDGYAYSFNMDDVRSMELQLAAGIDFTIPYQDNGASLAWKLTGENPSGQTILTNTVPTIILDDLLNPGIEICERIWTRMVRYHDPNATLFSSFKKTGYENTSAAFAQMNSHKIDAYLPFGEIESETVVQGWAQYLSAIDLVAGSQRRGRHRYNAIRGTGVLAYRIYHNTMRKHHYRLIPKQIPIESMLTSFVATMVQADIISDNLPTVGTITQPSTSFTGSVSSGEVLEAQFAAFCKRFSIGGTIMSGVGALNQNVNVLGAGRQYYVSMDILNFHVGINIQEALAELSGFELVTSDYYSELFVPFLCMRGEKTRANVFENSANGSPSSVMSMLRKVYPRLDPQSNFNFGVGGTEDQVFDITKPDTGFFTGSGPVERRATVNDMTLRMQGNIGVGSVLANIHDQDYTNLYFTELAAPAAIGDGFSPISETTITSISNRFAFSPNEVSDNLLRILPINYASNQQAYVGITLETVSLDLGANYLDFKVPEFILAAHPVQGPGVETVMSDFGKIRQHIGGGFIDTLKTIGGSIIPLLAKIGGSFANSYAPGSGELISNLGNHFGALLREGSDHESRMNSELVDKVLRNSWKNPSAVILRPFSNKRSGATRRLRSF